ncbi:MAG: hypothetical protein RR662_08005 [Clostridia bacterium]
MATSGNFTTSDYGGRALLFSWSINAQDIANNQTQIYWTLKGTGSKNTFHRCGPVYLDVDGERKVDGGGRFDLYGETLVASGFKWIGHDADGGKVFGASCSAAIYTAGCNVSGSGSWRLETIPRSAELTRADDFNDEQNPYMEMRNPGGFNLSVKLEAGGQDPIVSRPNIGNCSNYTFWLNEEERNRLRRACTGNSITVRYTLMTQIGGTTHYRWLDRTMHVVNSNPTFTHFEYGDVNPTTLALTKNQYTFIKNYSHAYLYVPVGNKALPNKQATMQKYRAFNQEVGYNASAEVAIQVNNIGTNILEMYAIDSRNNATKVTRNAILVDYTNIVIKNVIMQRGNGGVGQTTNLAFNGEFFNAKFGTAGIQNTIKAVSYRFKKKNESAWTNGATPLALTITNNTFKFDGLVKGNLQAEGFTMQDNFDIEITVADELYTYRYYYTLQAGKPLMALAPTKRCGYKREV